MPKKKHPSGGGDMARRIWLAGIGAYGRAFSEAQESLAKMNEETSRVFDELVEKGEKIEDTVEAKGRELARNVHPPQFSIDDRIKKMRERLGLVEGAGAHASSIEERLTAIEKKLDAVLEHLDSAPKPASRKKTTKKKSARKKSAAKSSTSKRAS